MFQRPDHRKSPRVSCGTPARVEGPRAVFEGTCRELSLGGLFFVGSTLPLGTSVELSWGIPNQRSVRAHGEVLYHRTNVRGMAIGFRRLAQDDLQIIQQYLASNGSSR